jgi:hypothetical protein
MTGIPEGLSLTSATWVAVEKWIKQQIEEQRDLLEVPLPLEETARIRGRIEQARSLLALGDDARRRNQAAGM